MRNRCNAYKTIIEHQTKLLDEVSENTHLVWDMGIAYGDEMRVSDLGHIVSCLMGPHTVGSKDSKVILKAGKGQVFYKVETSTFYFELIGFSDSGRFKDIGTLEGFFKMLKSLIPNKLMSEFYGQ